MTYTVNNGDGSVAHLCTYKHTLFCLHTHLGHNVESFTADQALSVLATLLLCLGVFPIRYIIRPGNQMPAAHSHGIIVPAV